MFAFNIIFRVEVSLCDRVRQKKSEHSATLSKARDQSQASSSDSCPEAFTYVSSAGTIKPKKCRNGLNTSMLGHVHPCWSLRPARLTEAVQGQRLMVCAKSRTAANEKRGLVQQASRANRHDKAVASSSSSVKPESSTGASRA